MIQNPIIEREFRLNLRKFRTYLVRSLYVVALIPPLLMVGLGNQSALGTREAFLVLMWIQLGTAAFLAPVFTAGTLCSERRRQTLGTLLLSDLSPAEIVSGMFFPRAAYLVMVILAALPVLILWIIFGSITGKEILAAQTVILGVAVLGASVGMFWSSLTKKAASALAGSYVTMILLLGAGPVAGRLARTLGFEGIAGILPTPIEVVSELFSLEGALLEGGVSAWRWALCTILFLLPAILFLRGASWFLNPFRHERFRSLSRALFRRAERGLDLRRWRIRFLDPQTPGRFANPIAWKELYASSWFGFRGVVILTGLLVVVSIPFWLATWGWWKTLWIHQVTIGAEFYLICLAATILSASSLAQEKESKSLDVLLTTPVKPHLIVGGKLFALTVTFWVLLIHPFIHIIFFTTVGYLSPATPLVFLVAAPMAVVFFVTQGLFISTGARTVLGAQSMALVGLHAWLIMGLLGITSVPHIWFLLLPASPFPLVLQGIRPGPAAALDVLPLMRLAKVDTFLLFLLSTPGAVVTMLMIGKLLRVLKERFYKFIR